MNWKENWWKFLILILVVLGLIWWRQNQNEPDEEVLSEAEVEEQVNRFLEDRGIILPEGGDRANLQDLQGNEDTGVATRVEEEDSLTYTVIASLPDPDLGWYVVWARKEGGEVTKLGRMRPAKGGYLLDVTVTEELEGYDEVVISQETGEVAEPSEVELEGGFVVVGGEE